MDILDIFGKVKVTKPERLFLPKISKSLQNTILTY